MGSNRKIAMVAAGLLILGVIAGLLSVVPVIEDPDYLVKVAANPGQVLSGAFFQFLMIPMYIGFALLLYPILQQHNQSLALGFVGFRMVAGTFHFIAVINLPLLLELSQEYVRAGAPDPSYYQTLGEMLRTGRDLVNHVAMILAMSLGDLMFFRVLYRHKLIPQWLSGWGLVGTVMAIFASLLLLFNLIDVVTPIYLVLNLPLALQGLVLAVWLIVKGFNPPTITTGTVEVR